MRVDLSLALSQLQATMATWVERSATCGIFVYTLGGYLLSSLGEAGVKS